jgi:hypothetical protein
VKRFSVKRFGMGWAQGRETGAMAALRRSAAQRAGVGCSEDVTVLQSRTHSVPAVTVLCKMASRVYDIFKIMDIAVVGFALHGNGASLQPVRGVGRRPAGGCALQTFGVGASPTWPRPHGLAWVGRWQASEA